MTEQGHPKALEIMTRLGIDPNTQVEPIPDFDVVAFRLEQAQKVLDRVTPALFREAKADHPEVADWVTRFLDAPSQAPSLLLSGPTGVGKTTQCWGAIRACVEGVAATGRGLHWRAVTYPDFNAAMRPNGDQNPEATLTEYMQVDLLLLDDLGVGLHTNWTGDNLYRLVDTRWANRRTTIYSTNRTSKDLAEAVGDRVVSRLADAQRVILKGTDRRWAAL